MTTASIVDVWKEYEYETRKASYFFQYESKVIHPKRKWLGPYYLIILRNAYSRATMFFLF